MNGNLAQRIYLGTRRRVRHLVTGTPWLDRRLGKKLVAVDLLLRRLGILDSALAAGQIQHDGLKLYYGKAQQSVASFLVTNGDYEPATRKVIETHLPPGGTFVDLGAHIGWLTLVAARRVGMAGRVFAFEPTPQTRTLLERNVHANGFSDRVVIEPYAITRERGTARFSIHPVAASNSITTSQNVTPDESAPSAVIEVETRSLDEYFAARGWPRVDLIKMDIEGQELAAIRSMAQLAARRPRMRLIFEYHRAQISRVGVEREEIFSTLRRLGLERFTVLDHEPWEIDLPRQLAELEERAARTNLNILAERP